MALTSSPRSNTNANVLMGWHGDAAPVDGTSGTLATIAEKGALYIDLTNAKIYINGGTQASPAWKIVTSA